MHVARGNTRHTGPAGPRVARIPSRHATNERRGLHSLVWGAWLVFSQFLAAGGGVLTDERSHCFHRLHSNYRTRDTHEVLGMLCAYLADIFLGGEHKRPLCITRVASTLVIRTEITQDNFGGMVITLPLSSALHNRTYPCPLTSNRTRNARAPTSPRSIGFCAIWESISSSSS